VTTDDLHHIRADLRAGTRATLADLRRIHAHPDLPAALRPDIEAGIAAAERTLATTERALTWLEADDPDCFMSVT
jgi:hypothetical protein